MSRWSVRPSSPTPYAALLAAATLAAPGLATAKKEKAPTVEITTSMGVIEAKLDPKTAPITVENFLKYVEDSFYDGTVFHRVIDGFMIQGGGMTADLSKKDTRAPIKLEAGRGVSNRRGTLAMARTNDPDSATSQFFINVVDNPRLDAYGGGYAVFGEVTKGLDVVDKIKVVATTEKAGNQNVPVTPVVIESIRLAAGKAAKKK